MAVTVSCVDDAPTAVNDTKTVPEDSGPTAIDVLANDTDADGGPMTINSVTQPAHGTVAIAGDGLSVSPTPRTRTTATRDPPASTDDFTYTLNGGSTATVAVTVTCVDDAPTAVNDTKTVTEDSGPTAIDVLANDTDPDGGPKTIDLGHPARPRHGGDHRRRPGLTYTPNPNYCNTRPAGLDRRLHLHPERRLDRDRGGHRHLRR